MEPVRITAREREDGRFELDSYDAQSLFSRALSLQTGGRCTEAAEVYDRLADEFPTSRFRSPGLYNAGFCFQDRGEFEEAILWYERLVEGGGGEDDVRHAGFQLAQLLVELERFADAQLRARDLLEREDLSPTERLEALARLAQAQLGLGQLEDAEREARNALLFFRARPEGEPIADDRFAAVANFVLAEALRRRGERIGIPAAAPDEQHEALERRSELMLSAQREYFNTIGFRNAHWAGAAGYRIGEMYNVFWEAITSAPPPPEDVPEDEELRAVWLAEYRLELQRWVKPLIRHAIRYWELTLLMVERTQASSEWTERIRGDLELARVRLLEQPEERLPEGTSVP